MRATNIQQVLSGLVQITGLLIVSLYPLIVGVDTII